MKEPKLSLHYDIDGTDFLAAGSASSDTKRILKQSGIDARVIRNVAIAMYEGEINTVIHAGGGTADVNIYDDCIEIILTDHGPGIENVEQAMQEGFSTAPENVRALGFGAGMGLPNMKKYTDEMTVESEIGTGTVVTMKVNL